ncbi:MAG: DUF302 domain-containing protein [bacterium]|nr:DUF302 domain-containing protein [bacterium]
MLTYGLTKELNMQFEETLEKVSVELKKSDLLVLSIIDLKEKFKEKLGIDFKKYVILGTYYPPNAYQAILAEENIGLIFPYNIALYERDKKTVLSIIKPTAIAELVDNLDLHQIILDMERKLRKIFDSIEDRK